MSKTLQPEFTWDEKTHSATCVLSNGQDVFVGIAVCNPVDYDMSSEKVGCQIALFRATIDYYIHLKNHVYKPKLEAINHLYSTIKDSKNFNKSSYEARRIRKSIYQLENDLNMTNQMLKDERETLRKYINDKDEFYKKIRKNRNKDKID